MSDAVEIICIVLGVLLCLVLLIELISGICKRVKMKQQEKQWKEESMKDAFADMRRRLDCFSETVGQMNWKLSEMEDKLNEKKNNRTKRNK